MLAFLAAAALFGGPDPAAQARLEQLGRAAYEAYWQLYPVDATRSGCHDFDTLLGDFSAANVGRLKKRLRAYVDTLDRLDTTGLMPDDRIDRLLLAASLKQVLFWLDTRRTLETHPRFYVTECIDGVYFLLLRDFAPLTDRARSVAARMERVPGFIAQARKNTRQHSRLQAGAAIDGLREGAALYRASAYELGQQFPELKARLDAACARSTAAMDSWRDRIEAGLAGCPDDFAMGREQYDWLLREVLFLGFDSDSLLRLGENLFRLADSTIEARQAEQAEYYRRHLRPDDPNRPAPRGWNKASVLAYHEAEIESMRAWTARAGVATVPEWVGRFEVTETPAFLRKVIPGLAMQPPAPLDSVQTGKCYIPPLPELDSARRVSTYNDARRRSFRGGAVHEGFPGHYFQFALANRHPSFIRRMNFDPCLCEGWALYCEQLVVEQGLYPPDPFPDLRWLGGVKFRAARVILDVKLHTGRMSYDDAWRFMCRHFGPDTAYLQAEVRRYCLTPTQPMSYLVGKTQVTALRDEWLERTGGTLREFHDRLLAEGSTPLALIRRKLLEER